MVESDLFRRAIERTKLSRAFAGGHTRIVCVHGHKGSGKTQLVSDWLTGHVVNPLTWSAPGQGDERPLSPRRPAADAAITEFLIELGDPDPYVGSPDDRGSRLARLVAATGRAVFLDGLEVFLDRKSQVTDRGLAAFLDELLKATAGFCVVTSRQRPVLGTAVGLPKDRHRYECIELPALTIAELRQALGRKTSEHPLLAMGKEEEARVPLVFNLFAFWSELAREQDQDDTVQSGADPVGRILDTIRDALPYHAEWRAMLTLGLFEREAEITASSFVQAAGPHVLKAMWHRLKPLRRLMTRHRLLRVREGKGFRYSTHPDFRIYMREQLRADTQAWRAGHSRLFEYYRQPRPGEDPKSVAVVERMMLAVRHGCHAGRFRDALGVYLSGVQGDQSGGHLASYRLGLVQSNLYTLSHFFGNGWRGWKTAATDDQQLGTADRLKIIQDTAFDLWHAANFDEAEQAFAEMAYQGELVRQDGQPQAWTNKSSADRLCCEIDLTRGKLHGLAARLERQVNEADELTRSYGPELRPLSLTRALLGRVYHCAGLPDEADRAHTLATHETNPDPWVNFVACDFWLDQGELERVVERIGLTFTHPRSAFEPGWHLHQGLIYALLTRSALVRSGRDHTVHQSLTTHWANKAVYHLRHSGQIPHYPVGLIAHEEWNQFLEFFGRRPVEVSSSYLNTLLRLTAEYGLRLFGADAHLLAASRYSLCRIHTSCTRHRDRAADLLAETGYARRAKRLCDLKAAGAESKTLHLLSLEGVLYKNSVKQFDDKRAIGWYEGLGYPARQQLADDLLMNSSAEIRASAARLLGEFKFDGLDDTMKVNVAKALGAAAVADSVREVRLAAREAIKEIIKSDHALHEQVKDFTCEFKYIIPDPYYKIHDLKVLLSDVDLRVRQKALAELDDAVALIFDVIRHLPHESKISVARKSAQALHCLAEASKNLAEQRILTTEQAAHILGKSEQAVTRLARLCGLGELRGRSYFFSESEIEMVRQNPPRRGRRPRRS